MYHIKMCVISAGITISKNILSQYVSCEFVEGSMPTVMNIHNFCKIICIAFMTNPCCHSAHQRLLSISTTVLLTSLGSHYPCNSIGLSRQKKKKKSCFSSCSSKKERKKEKMLQILFFLSRQIPYNQSENRWM